MRDRLGNLWVGSGTGVHCLGADRSWRHYSVGQGLPSETILSLLEDARGKLWVGTGAGLCRLSRDSASQEYTVEQTYRRQDGLAGDYVSALSSGRGQLWVGTLTGLSRLGLGSTGDTPVAVEEIGGLSVEALIKDPDENLWVGTDGGGAVKLALGGFTSFSTADGLRSNSIVSILESSAGELCAITRERENLFLNWLDGARFRSVRLNLPRQVSSLGWGWDRILRSFPGG